MTSPSTWVTGFRTDAVGYDAIARSAAVKYTANMGTVVQQTADEGRKWYLARKAANDASPLQPLPPIPVEWLDLVADACIQDSVADITQNNTDSGGLETKAKENMLRIGWFGAGAWYSTFAEANAAIADAAKGPAIFSKKPESGLGYVNTETSKALAAANGAMADALKAQDSNTGDSSRAILDSAIRDHCSSSTTVNSLIGTATGNCSLGQGIVSAAIRASAIGSGGGGDGGNGDISFDILSQHEHCRT